MVYGRIGLKKSYIRTNFERMTILAKRRLLTLLSLVTIYCIVIVATFPELDWFFGVGIDDSLSWVFNHFANKHVSLAQHLRFPHGPLAYFMYPLPENGVSFLILNASLKLMLLLGFYLILMEPIDGKKLFFIGLATYLLAAVASFNHLLISVTLLFLCVQLKRPGGYYKYLAFTIIAMSLYVRGYVAIITGLLGVTFTLIEFWKSRRSIILFFNALVILGCMIAIWLLLFQQFNGFFGYLRGLYELAQDNSSAASYYPENDWPILGLSLLFFLAVLVVNLKSESMSYWVLIIPALFGAWKHGMAREDYYHVIGLLDFLTIVFLTNLFYTPKRFFASSIFSIMSLICFHVNCQNAQNFKTREYNWLRHDNFVLAVSKWSTTMDSLKALSQEQIKGQILPSEMRNIIANNTVDVYPWEYSIVAVNELNWHPRPILQSYAAYTDWLDELDAKHFSSSTAPQFLIWEFDKVTTDKNGGQFNSIDGRYLLNDEPKSTIQVLNRYEYVMDSGKFRLYKMRTNSSEIEEPRKIGELHGKWGEWITVPENQEGLVRARLEANHTLIGKLKSFFYKDEQMSIILKFRSGETHKYRIVPKNAVTGLWINPYLFDQETTMDVERIMFLNSNPNCFESGITIQWEYYDSFSRDYLDKFFGFQDSSSSTRFFHYFKNFDSTAAPISWTSVTPDQLASDSLLNFFQQVPPNQYSSTLRISLDTLPIESIKAHFQCKVRFPDSIDSKTNPTIVISIEQSGKSIVWNGIPIQAEVVDSDWNLIRNHVNFSERDTGMVLSAYVWNNSAEVIHVDDLSLVIRGSK